jgi:DNA polymerase-4
VSVGSEGLILHVDADAFFASVEQRQKPSTARVPVIVGGLGPRGVVATASYQAHRFGVGSAMATATAMRRCPHGVFLPPDAGIPRTLRGHHDRASRFADALERVSIDDAYLEIRSLTIPADRLITEVAAAVWQATGLRVSMGGGHSKLLAKLASTSAKPQGVRVISSEQQQAFLDALPVTALPGIGPVAAARLTEMGINTVAQLRAQPTRLLQRLLGLAAGSAAVAMAQGRDTRPVGPSREAKTLSAERTMDYDVPASQLVPVLDTVLDAAHHRLAESGAAARTVTVRLRNAQFITIGRSVSLPQASTKLSELRSAALTALRAATEAMGLDTEEESGAGANLLGVALGALSTSPQPTLLPGETTHQSPTDPAALTPALPLPQQDNQPTALGHRANDWMPGRDVQHTELDADGLCGQPRHWTHPPERTSCTCASKPPTPDLRANAASRSATPT